MLHRLDSCAQWSLSWRTNEASSRTLTLSLPDNSYIYLSSCLNKPHLKQTTLTFWIRYSRREKNNNLNNSPGQRVQRWSARCHNNISSMLVRGNTLFIQLRLCGTRVVKTQKIPPPQDPKADFHCLSSQREANARRRGHQTVYGLLIVSEGEAVQAWPAVNYHIKHPHVHNIWGLLSKQYSEILSCIHVFWLKHTKARVTSASAAAWPFFFFSVSSLRQSHRHMSTVRERCQKRPLCSIIFP